MFWRDFFYFSKGERSGLIVLLSIIVVAVTILFITKQKALKNEPPAIVTSSQTATPDSLTATAAAAPAPDSSNPAAPSASPNRSTTARQPATTPSSADTKETVRDRVNRLTSPNNSRPSYERVEKYAAGTVVELNTADTTSLKKVPGIGTAFANRIVNYRNSLGGFYSVLQLSEVYGIDEDRFADLKAWFTVDPSFIVPLEVNRISQDTLQRHPYISYAQARVIIQLRRQKGQLNGWENLQLLNEFTAADQSRLQHYLSFQ